MYIRGLSVIYPSIITGKVEKGQCLKKVYPAALWNGKEE
jgi:hypothetical protein